MRRMGYYPALIVILLLCAAGVGVFVFLTMGVAKKIGSYKSSDELYAATVKQLEEAKAAQRDSEQSDRMYTEYLTRWAQQEGQLDEAKLKQRLQKIAEGLGVQVQEMAPLGTDEAINPTGRTARPPARRRSEIPGRVDPALPLAPVRPGMPGHHDIELKVTLIGPFNALMAWLGRAEAELGGLRIISTNWMARSPEEVRLSVGLRYKKIEMIGETP